MAAKDKTGASREETPLTLPAVKPTKAQKTIGMQAKLDQILKFAIQGDSIRQISERMPEAGFTKGVSRANVGKLLKKALETSADRLTLKAKHHVTLELEKMREIERTHLRKLVNARNPDDINKLMSAISRIWTRRDALLGLNKPTKIEHTGEDGGPITILTRVIEPGDEM